MKKYIAGTVLFFAGIAVGIILEVRAFPTPNEG